MLSVYIVLLLCNSYKLYYLIGRLFMIGESEQFQKLLQFEILLY